MTRRDTSWNILKHCESCPTKMSCKVNFKCQSCFSCLSSLSSIISLSSLSCLICHRYFSQEVVAKCLPKLSANTKITDYGRLQLTTPLNFESCLRSLEILWKIFWNFQTLIYLDQFCVHITYKNEPCLILCTRFET